MLVGTLEMNAKKKKQNKTFKENLRGLNHQIDFPKSGFLKIYCFLDFRHKFLAFYFSIFNRSCILGFFFYDTKLQFRLLALKKNMLNSKGKFNLKK